MLRCPDPWLALLQPLWPLPPTRQKHFLFSLGRIYSSPRYLCDLILSLSFLMSQLKYHLIRKASPAHCGIPSLHCSVSSLILLCFSLLHLSPLSVLSIHLFVYYWATPHQNINSVRARFLLLNTQCLALGRYSIDMC